MKRLDKAILLHDMIEEFKKMLQKLLDKMDLKDYFRFGLDAGYLQENECKCELCIDLFKIGMKEELR